MVLLWRKMLCIIPCEVGLRICFISGKGCVRDSVQGNLVGIHRALCTAQRRVSTWKPFWPVKRSKRLLEHLPKAKRTETCFAIPKTLAIHFFDSSVTVFRFFGPQHAGFLKLKKDPTKRNFRHSSCVVICFADGRIQDIVGVRFIEPDITGLMNQAPTL